MLALATAACPVALAADEVRVAVASNFRPVLQRLAGDFESRTGLELLISSGSTGKHYAQIRNGAPFDLFLAADSQLDLPTEAELGEYRSNYFTELDREEGQVYSYNLSIQHEIFTGTKLEVGCVGNQGRHLREISAFNVAYEGADFLAQASSLSTTLPATSVRRKSRPWKR